MTIQETINEKYKEDIQRAIELGNKYEPNAYGQFPWDAGEYPRDGRPHRSLNLSKASLGTFFEAALRHRIGIGSVWALDPRYKKCAVLVRCHATIKQRENFMEETGFYLTPVPIVHFN